MKRSVLTTLFAAGAVLTSSATVYWQGPAGTPTDWLGSSTATRGWWCTGASGTGNWQYYPDNENAHVKNGGIAVITSSVAAVQKLVLNFQYRDLPSCVRVDAGGALTCTHAYVTHDSGTDGAFHINGGSATIGETGTAPGLFAPSSSAPNGKGTVLVTGGSLDVYSTFSIGAQPPKTVSVHEGSLIVSNGVVTSHCDLELGKLDTVGRGRMEVSGGRVHGTKGTELIMRNGSQVLQSGGDLVFDAATADGEISLSGGTADFGKLRPCRGGRIKVSGTALLTGGLTVRDDTATEGATNEIFVAGGTVSVTNFAGNLPGSIPYAWILTENPFRYLQTGGNVNLDRLYFNAGASRDARLAVDGGTFVCGGNVCVFDQPFYFRHSGAASVTFAGFPDATKANQNTNGVNCLIDHVIDRGALSPIRIRDKIGNGADSRFNVFGRNVLRPAGGVQIVTNETFSLFACNAGGAPNTQYCSGVPDANLWTTARIGKQYVWGSTLTAEACVGTVANRGAVAFAPTPFGYASLPEVRTNKLARYAVTLTVEPQAATLAEIAANLSAAGYENVTTAAGAEPTVTFEVPKDWLTDRQQNAKLLFDFTETRCPNQFVTGTMDFPVTTNALVKSVALTVDKENCGLLLLFR